MSALRLALERPCPLNLGQLPDKHNHTWFCSQCKESVYDLSSMGPERAAALLQERAHGGQEVCGQWYADDAGRVLFNVTRAAAAAAAVFIATPALADGDDIVIPDAIEFLLGDAGVANRDAHQASHRASESAAEQDASGIDTGTQPTVPIRRYAGRMRVRPTTHPAPSVPRPTRKP